MNPLAGSPSAKSPLTPAAPSALATEAATLTATIAAIETAEASIETAEASITVSRATDGAVRAIGMPACRFSVAHGLLCMAIGFTA